MGGGFTIIDSAPASRVLLAAALCLGLTGCSKDSAPSDQDGGGDGLTGVTTAGGDTDGSADGSGDGGQDGDADGDGSGEGEEDGDGIKFDIGDPDPDPDCTEVGEGGASFSYIWIANSNEGTVSKINTETGVEEGRYRTSATGSHSPSRTSVNQFGDVAVGNRTVESAVTKIAAIVDRCVERNGVPGIQTSTGPNDVLPFMEDECVLWSVPFATVANNTGPRAIAWEGGELDPATCTNTVPNPRLWVGYGTSAQEVYRLDGATGAVLDHITIPSDGGLIYGGAVNGAGDLWMVNRGTNQLIRVDAQTVMHTSFAIPNTPYGMGVDQDGDPWVVSYQGGAGTDHVWRFDVATSTFVDAGGAQGYYRGMNLDREGRVWVAGNAPCRLAVFDSQTDTMIRDDIALPGCTTPVGVSIDAGGGVWVVDNNGTAFKVDPDTYAVQFTVTGLVGPYTYSDMTGSGLDLVVNPPG